MRFDLLKSALALAIMLILITAPTSAVKFAAAAGNGAGASSASGEYRLQNSASLESDITLGDGVVSRLSSAHGNGENVISEGVSGGDSSVTNTIASDASISYNSNDFGCGAGAISDYQASLEGLHGSIHTVSTAKEDQMIVAGGFYGQGGMDVSLDAFSSDTAFVGGNIESEGIYLLDDELSQHIASKEMKMSVEGFYISEDAAIGKFGLQAISQKGKPAPQPPSPPVVLDFNQEWLSSDINSGHPETVSNGGSSSSFSPTVWKIGDTPIQLCLRSDSNLAGEGLTAAQAGQAIITAAETWDYYTEEELFKDSILMSSSFSADKSDGMSVHAFKPIAGSAIAYARTYRDSSNIVVESDVCYNTRLGWTTAWGSTYPIVDLQSIALHELGHTAGLGDLYLLDKSSTGYNDWYQIMNSYDGPQHNLGDGDIRGLQLKYGDVETTT